MLQRFHTDDLFAIAHYLGMLIIFLSVTMLVPLIVACLFGEWAVATHYIVGIGVAFFIGSLLRLCKANPKRLTRMQAIAITGLAWVVGALFSAIPLYLSGHYASFLDSVFECVSGFTTTGLSLTLDIDHMSMADSMWRCGIQFLGGQGILVIALSLGLFTKTGTSFYNSEGREEAILPNMRKTTQFIMRFAFMIVIAGTLVLGVVAMSVGMDPIRSFFHGLWITIGSYDTGGFAVQSLSVSYYHSWPFEIVTMVIMCLGTVNFGLFAYVQKTGWREFLRDIEIRSLAIWILAMVVVFVAAMMAGNFLTDYLGLIRRGIFTIISATTNTGYQVLSSNQMATLMTSGAFFLIALSMAVGGSSGSTAGGIKALRVGLIAKGIVARVKQVLLPKSAQISSTYEHMGKHKLTGDLLSSALIIASLYVITYIIGTLAGISYGYGALPSAFESISAASNAGLTSGLTAVGMPALLKVIYILEMWMGRLEFITLLALVASFIASIVPHRRRKHKKAA